MLLGRYQITAELGRGASGTVSARTSTAASGDTRGAIADYEKYVARAAASDPELPAAKRRLEELRSK